MQKIPAIFAVGAREGTERTVAVRRFGSKAQQVMSLNDATVALQNEAEPASRMVAREAAE